MSDLDDEELETTRNLSKNRKDREVGQMYQCFHCLKYAVAWDNDFDFEDYGIDGEGIVHVCHCGNCGAEIEYFVPDKTEDI